MYLISPLDLIPVEYEGFAAPIFRDFGSPKLTTKESDVAQAVWAAVHNANNQLRFPAGADAVELSHTRFAEVPLRSQRAEMPISVSSIRAT